MRRAAMVLSFVGLGIGLGLASCGPGSRVTADEPAGRAGEERRVALQDARADANAARVGAGAPTSPLADVADVANVANVTAQAEQREGVVLVTDRDTLAFLEEHGADFGSVVDGDGARGAHNDVLAKRPPWAAIAGVLSDDVREAQRADAPLAGVAVAQFPHRLFDVRWLSASTARFELVAVVDRIDRRAFHARACGETRLVYRLAYRRDDPRGKTITSRLPMTVNVELRGDDRDGRGECRQAAARWFAPSGAKGAELGRWLVSAKGPLSGGALAHDRLVQLVVNMQHVRWPSAVRPDLGGHAEYILRAFAWSGADRRYAPRSLENTPDVSKLRQSRALRAELLAWLRAPAHLRGIDEATVVLPEKFLATRIVSVTPRGFARLANRPFRQLFEPGEFGDLPLGELRFARSPEALLRRLDDATCAGCHQRRAVAGFHLLGEDPPETVAGNALAVSFSPHVASELKRRRSYLAQALAGGALDDARPFAERSGASDDGYGAPCGLGDRGFASWTCAAGLRCDGYESAAGEDAVGVCLPEVPSIGDPCEVTRVAPDRDPHRDRAGRAMTRSCAAIGGVCEATRVGFPGGMCATGCDALPPGATCGAIAVLADFNACVARKSPFQECLATTVRPAGLRACSESAPCRDDYICARTASGGACIPPYFLFQLRVDGHSP